MCRCVPHPPTSCPVELILPTQLDQLKLVLLLFLSVPLSLVFPYLPSSTTSVLPHLFSALPSVVFLWTVLHLRSGFFQLLGSSLLTWVIVKRGIANKEGKAMPWKVFAVAMGHLTIKCVSSLVIFLLRIHVRDHGDAVERWDGHWGSYGTVHR